MRFFNTAGPVNADDHYHVPPLSRLDRDELLLLIRQKKYFVLHAPRQTGKTSALLALRDELNGGGRYRCVYVNVEGAQAAREDVEAGMRAVLGRIASWARKTLRDDLPGAVWPGALATDGPHGALEEVLGRWAEADAKPLILLIDEIDTLVGDTLLSVLRQLRAGYVQRPSGFPQSVVLCGVRDVRDYRIRSSAGQDVIAGGSAFNIKAESLRLGDFTQPEVLSLLGQHTEATGQAFTECARHAVWTLTCGQPWLVNALAYEACFRDRAGRDRTRPVTADAVDAAREQLIARRETHLDQLADKLREQRVQRVIEPLLTGAPVTAAIPADDLDYVRDLGLVRRESPVAIANPIYREVIPRDLTWTTQEMTATHDPAWYVGRDGRLLTTRLLAAFQTFFREHSEHWVERFQYKEAGPQLLLQAFLQRIVNSGGRIEREYGLGRMRTDLLIVWPLRGAGGRAASAAEGAAPTGGAQAGAAERADGAPAKEPAPGGMARQPASSAGAAAEGALLQKTVVECKVLHGSLERTVELGLDQVRAYMDRCAAREGHLVVFDRTPDVPWDDKVFRRERTAGGAPVTVWGM